MNAFDFDQAKEVLGSSVDVEKFMRMADEAGRVSKDLLEVAVADFGTMCTVPAIPSLDAGQAEAVLGHHFDPETFAKVANEAGKVSREGVSCLALDEDEEQTGANSQLTPPHTLFPSSPKALQAIVGDFSGIDIAKLMQEFHIDDKMIQVATGEVGKALTLAADAIGPEIVQVVEKTSVEVAKVAGDAIEGGVKLVSKIPVPMIGTGLQILGQIQQMLYQAKINKRNATAAWGRLRVIQMVLQSVDDDVRANAQNLGKASGTALQSMNEAASRVALGLAHVKELISDYNLAPAEEPPTTGNASAWGSAWSAIEGAAAYVKETVITMVTAE